MMVILKSPSLILSPPRIHQMMEINSGLKSRFAHFLDFPDWESQDCVAWFEKRAGEQDYSLCAEATEEHAKESK